MKSSSIIFASVLFTGFFVSNIQAYVILNAKTEVSPGCVGGISSHTSISIINDPIDPKESNDHQESEEAEVLSNQN